MVTTGLMNGSLRPDCPTGFTNDVASGFFRSEVLSTATTLADSAFIAGVDWPFVFADLNGSAFVIGAALVVPLVCGDLATTAWRAAGAEPWAFTAGTATATGFTACTAAVGFAVALACTVEGFTATATGFATTTARFDAVTATTFTVVGEGFAAAPVACVDALALTAVCTFFCITAGFCATALAPNANHNEIVRVRFIYVLPLAFAAVTAGGGASWLKNVVAVHVATTLSFGAY